MLIAELLKINNARKKIFKRYNQSSCTCLYPLAERAMANLRPSLVKTGASSSSNQPPGDVMIKLSWQSPLWRKYFSLFVFCLFAFLSFPFLSFCLFVFLPFCLFVFLSFVRGESVPVVSDWLEKGKCRRATYFNGLNFLPEGFADGHHTVVLVPVLPGQSHLVLGEEAKFSFKTKQTNKQVKATLSLVRKQSLTRGLIQTRLQKLFIDHSSWHFLL